MNRTLLQKKMREQAFTADALSKKIGMGRATFFRKLRSEGEAFTIKEVEDICSALGLTRTDVHAIFFNPSVSDVRQKGEMK